MVAAASQTFSAAASVAPIKMWSNACQSNVYVSVKNNFLDFYTDEMKLTKGSAIPRSSSVDSPTSKSTRCWESAMSLSAGMSASTRSPSPSTGGEDASVDSMQPQDSPKRRAKIPQAASSPALCQMASVISLSENLPSSEEPQSPNSPTTSGRAWNDKRKWDLSKTPASPDAEKTTVMIRGIPCSFTKNGLMEVMDRAGLAGKYNFFYLPKGSSNGNLGYAFVNFVHPMYVNICKAAMHRVALDPVRSAKMCTISAADVQGLENLRKHFRRTAVSRSEHGPVFLKC